MMPTLSARGRSLRPKRTAVSYAAEAPVSKRRKRPTPYSTGLHFSLYGTLANVIRSEFADIIPEEDAREAALILLPQAREVARSYELADDFAATPQYALLYTELTGTVQILLDNGIQ